MINIKQIDDKELPELIELNYQYNQCLVTKHNRFNSTKSLLDRLATPHALALGLYRDSKLLGFTIGYGLSKETFYFTDMYIVQKARYYTSKLLIESESFIKSLGYTSWTSESHTKDGMRMFKHYGAKIVEIKYYKDIQ